jgi:hypothetical protein
MRELHPAALAADGEERDPELGVDLQQVIEERRGIVPDPGARI